MDILLKTINDYHISVNFSSNKDMILKCYMLYTKIN